MYSLWQYSKSDQLCFGMHVRKSLTNVSCASNKYIIAEVVYKISLYEDMYGSTKNSNRHGLTVVLENNDVSR